MSSGPMSVIMHAHVQAGEPVVMLDPLPDRRLVHQASEIACARGQDRELVMTLGILPNRWLANGPGVGKSYASASLPTGQRKSALERYLDAAVGRPGSGKSYRIAHELTCVPALRTVCNNAGF
jgi:hypothetical protein